MGCTMSRHHSQSALHPCDDQTQNAASRSLGIDPNDIDIHTYKTVKSPSSHPTSQNDGLGIRPRFRLDISSSSSSSAHEPKQDPYRLIERLGQARIHIAISSDDDSSDSKYSNDTSSQPFCKSFKQHTTDASFLSSKRDNQSIDDVGEDESVVDWLATSNDSLQTPLISEDDATTNSPIFNSMTPSQHPILATPRKLDYTGVKSTERVERRHVDLPKNKPPRVVTGDWLSHRYVVNDYIILNEIGRGAFAEVRLCKHKTTNKMYACKIMSRKAFDPKEVAIMKKLRHPNVLQLYEVLDDQRVNKIYLVMDYLKRGDLMKALNNNSLNDFEVWNVTKQVMCGLDYLHQNNIVHNDLKPSNILLDNAGRCVIADFGIATPGRIRIDSAGTPSFMAPEVCNGEVLDGRLADCYSLGATIYCIRMGRPPYIGRGASKNQKLMDLHQQIKQRTLTFPILLNTDLENLITRLMEKDPRRRLTLPEALDHAWLEKRPS